MSRLLFAAARGARIQKWGSTIQKWFEVTDMFLIDEDDGDRIHPDDSHLGYGPISTALRGKAGDTAPKDRFGHDTLPYMDVSPYFDPDEFWVWAQEPELHRSLFLLILAEALADEGL